MDLSVISYLRRAYGYAKGKEKKLGPLTAEELSVIRAAGFEPHTKTAFSHDEMLDRWLKAAHSLDEDAVAAGLVGYVGGSYLAGGAIFLAFTIARHLRPHAYQKVRSVGSCGQCGLPEGETLDLAEENLRTELGHLWNELPASWFLDVERAAAEGIPTPREEDAEVFHRLLTLIDEAPSDETPSQLEKRIARSKLLPHTDKYRRYGLGEALGEAGVLPNPWIVARWSEFLSAEDWSAAHARLRGSARSDVVLPFGGWRGELGVAWPRAAAIFGARFGAPLAAK
jgi:hypothetical protein